MPARDDGDNRPAGALSDPGNLVRPLLPPAAPGAPAAPDVEETSGDATVPKDTVKPLVKEKSPASAPAPALSQATESAPGSADDAATAPGRSGEPHANADKVKADKVKNAPAGKLGSAQGSPPNGSGKGKPRAFQTLQNTTAAARLG